MKYHKEIELFILFFFILKTLPGDNPILRSIIKNNQGKQLSRYYDELKYQQEKLVPAALDMATPGNLSLHAANACSTLQTLSTFTPLFTQFLAWQRLMQMQDEVGFISRGDCPWPKLIGKRKRHVIEEEDEEIDEEPPTKKRKSTLKQLAEDFDMEVDIPEDKGSDFEVEYKPATRKRPTRKSARKNRSSSPIVLSPDEDDFKAENEESLVKEKEKVEKKRELRQSKDDKVSFLPPKDIPTVVPKKSMNDDASITESVTESTKEVTTTVPKQSMIIDSNNNSGTSSDLPSKPITTKEPEVFVQVNADFMRNGYEHSLGKISSLPSLIGRCDPSSSGKSNLNLNLQLIASDPSVKRVSHVHLEVFHKTDSFYALCLGRNGIVVDNNPLPKGSLVKLKSGIIIGVGPFKLTFKIQ